MSDSIFIQHVPLRDGMHIGGGEAPAMSPTEPTPGTRALTQHWAEAVAYSSNLFIRDSGVTDPTALLDVHETELPPVGADFASTAPEMQPFEVMSDGTVEVTAVLAPHGPVFPSNRARSA